MEYNAMTYPEGYERVKREELAFLPNEIYKEQYMMGLIQIIAFM